MVEVPSPSCRRDRRPVARYWMALASLALAVTSCSRSPSPPMPAPAEDLGLVPVRENGIEADFYCPRSGSRKRVVITLSGSEGGKWLSDNPPMIRDLLARGYCVLSLAYFNSGDLPRHLRRIPLEYFASAFEWLGSRNDVIPNEYALFGESRGAELALILASRHPQVSAVVALTPSHVSFPSPPTGILDALIGQHSSWTQDGQDLAHVAIPASLEAGRAVITRDWNAVMMRALGDDPAAFKATIPVEDITGPLLCISNTQDVQWPSTYSCEEIVKRLEENGFGYYYDHIAYDVPGAHAWCGEPCWTEVLAFLGDHFD